MHDTSRADNTQVLRGLWLIVVYFGIELGLETSKGIESWLYQILALPQNRWEGEPLLNLIRADLVDSYLAGMVFVVATLIVVIARKWYPVAAQIVILIALIQFLPALFVGVDISIQCGDLSSDATAFCPWASADSYVSNGRYMAYHFLTWLTVLVCAFIIGRRMKRRPVLDTGKA